MPIASRLKARLAVASNVAGVVLVGVVDYATGHEIRVYPLYFLPISLGAWTGGRAISLVVASLSAVTWFSSNLMAGAHYTPTVWTINASAQLVAFGLVAFLIAELRRRLGVERELSQRDVLTSLFNRRAFLDRAGPLLALAARTRQPITLAYVDLDHFKELNDRQGHERGDEALCLAANTLLESSRASDLVSRFGGDEFVLLLPNVDRAAAQAMLERVRAKIAAAMEASGTPVTASIGAACFSTPPATIDEALGAADGVMYRAKHGGRNRVSVETLEGHDRAGIQRASAPPLA